MTRTKPALHEIPQARSRLDLRQSLPPPPRHGPASALIATSLREHQSIDAQTGVGGP